MGNLAGIYYDTRGAKELSSYANSNCIVDCWRQCETVQLISRVIHYIGWMERIMRGDGMMKEVMEGKMKDKGSGG